MKEQRVSGIEIKMLNDVDGAKPDVQICPRRLPLI
jgi:hypothetical protein